MLNFTIFEKEGKFSYTLSYFNKQTKSYVSVPLTKGLAELIVNESSITLYKKGVGYTIYHIS